MAVCKFTSQRMKTGSELGMVLKLMKKAERKKKYQMSIYPNYRIMALLQSTVQVLEHDYVKLCDRSKMAKYGNCSHSANNNNDSEFISLNSDLSENSDPLNLNSFFERLKSS